MTNPVYNRNILRLVITCLAAVLLSVSCRKEIVENDVRPVYSDDISFGESLPEGWNEMTRSSGTEMRTDDIHVGTTPDGVKLLMHLTVEDGIEPCSPAVKTELEADTRATALPADDVLDLGVFSYWMLGESAPEYSGLDANEFMINNFVDVSDNYKYNPVKYWPGEGYWLKFFAYRPYEDNVNVDGEEKKYLEVTHEGNVPKLSYTVPEDVTKQVDLQAAQTEMIEGDYRQKVNLSFKHLLSAVKFKVGNMHGVTVEEISLKGLANIGEYTFDGQMNVSGRNGNFIQKPKNDDGESSLTASEYGQQIGETYYMLPQKFLDENAKLGLKIRFPALPGMTERVGRTQYTIDRPLKDFSASWDENKTYSYIISTPEEVKLEVNDVVDGKVKKDLVIKNTGLSTVFIRVSIVGEWVLFDKDGNYTIVGKWQESDGIFDWGEGNGGLEPPLFNLSDSKKDRWYKGPDGYYYFLAPVTQNTAVPVPLFESYTLTASAPVVDAELLLTIAAQAVIVEDVFINYGTESAPDFVWPTDIVTKLQTLE